MYRKSYGQMLGTAVVAILLGLVLLLYPGGIAAIIAAAFWVFQLLISSFILAYALSEAMLMFRMQLMARGIGYLLLGILGTLLVWLFDVELVYLIVAVFFLVTGILGIIEAMALPMARFFLTLLGLINVMMGVIILQYPIILPLLIAWYIFFWGVSRFFLALELRKYWR